MPYSMPISGKIQLSNSVPAISFCTLQYHTWTFLEYSKKSTKGYREIAPNLSLMIKTLMAYVIEVCSHIVLKIEKCLWVLALPSPKYNP